MRYLIFARNISDVKRKLYLEKHLEVLCIKSSFSLRSLRYAKLHVAEKRIEGMFHSVEKMYEYVITVTLDCEKFPI